MPEVTSSAVNGNGTVGGLKPTDAANGADDADRARTPTKPVAGTSDWIDAELIAEALGVQPDAVRDVTVKAAVAEGDNYCSCMWRAKATVASPEAGDTLVHLIVKAPPKGELMQSFVSNLGFFRREVKMLTETLPAMRAIATKRCGPDHPLSQQLGPVALPCSVPGTLVMQDLSVLGYRNKERQSQLDLQHCKLALEIVARLHALSIALHREDPTAMDEYGEAFFTKNTGDEGVKMAKTATENQLVKFANLVDNMEQTKDKQYGEKMRQMAPHLFDDLCDLIAPKEDRMSVLNHGDFWINNMMFLYDGEETVDPKDVILVDLQLVRYSSKAVDLQYFIMTSAKEQVREEQLDDMLQHYCQHFNDYVADLGMADAQTSPEQLKEEFLSMSLFGFSTVYTVMCAVVAQPEDRLQLDAVSAEQDLSDVDFASKAWQGAAFQRLLPKVLDHFADVGLLS